MVIVKIDFPFLNNLSCKLLQYRLAHYHSKMNSRLPRDATLRFISPKINLVLPQGFLSEITNIGQWKS